MRALARLAGEDAYSVSSGIGKISRAIRASDSLGINEDHVRAYENIVERVSDWALAAKQARNVRHLVAQNGADMDKLLEAMQLATEAGIVLEQEIQSYEVVADYRQAQQGALKAQRAAAMGLKRVREAHAAMLRNVDRLDTEQIQARLREAADDLKDIRESLSEL